MSKHKVRVGKLSEFRPQSANANKHTERGLRMLDDAMSEDGYVAPATAAADGEMIDGSARLERAFDKFNDEAIIVEHDGTRPIIAVRTDIPNAKTQEAKRIAVRANRIAQVDLEWNPDILAELAPEELKGMFSDKELAEILSQTGVEPKDAEPQIDKAEELRQKWGTETGQLWEIGPHLLLCGDSTDAGHVSRLVGNTTLDISVTDPPYDVGIDYGETTNDSKGRAAYSEWCARWLAHLPAKRVITVGIKHLFWWDEIAGTPQWVIAWVKRNGQGNNGFGGTNKWDACLVYGAETDKGIDVIEVNNDYSDQMKSDGAFPVAKPEELWRALIERFSQRSDVVYDPFGGSGTSLVAAENSGRKAYCLEISPAYVAVCLERMTKAFPNLKIERVDQAAAA